KPLRPLPVDLHVGVSKLMNLIGWMRICPWPTDSEKHTTVLRSHNLHLVTRGQTLSGIKIAGSRNRVIKALDFSGCDGRGRFGLLGTNFDASYITKREEQVVFGFVIERSIRETKTKVEYTLSVADGEFRSFDPDKDHDTCYAWLY